MLCIRRSCHHRWDKIHLNHLWCTKRRFGTNAAPPVVPGRVDVGLEFGLHQISDECMRYTLMEQVDDNATAMPDLVEVSALAQL